MQTKLILIRHGETDMNLRKRYSGFLDCALTKTGILQAKKLSKRMENEKVQKIYSSDLKRAVESGRIIFKNRPMKIVAGLREINFGFFEGLNHSEIMRTYPKEYSRWLKKPMGVAIPGGESLKSFAVRVRREFSLILSRNKGKTVAIVAHGGTNRIILCGIMGLSLNKFWDIDQENGCFNLIEFNNGKAKICVINDTEHLNG